MILLPDRGLCVFTPPKTASASLHKYLNAHGAQTYYGPNPGGAPGFSKHTLIVPEEAQTFPLVALVIRNPWDRLVSLFHHFHAWEGHEGRAGLSFADFIEAAHGRGPVALPWFYTVSLARYAQALTNAGLAFHLWTTELLAQHLAAADLAPQPGQLLTVEGWSYRRPTHAYYDDSTLAGCWQSAHPDRMILRTATQLPPPHERPAGPLAPGPYWTLPPAARPEYEDPRL